MYSLRPQRLNRYVIGFGLLLFCVIKDIVLVGISRNMIQHIPICLPRKGNGLFVCHKKGTQDVTVKGTVLPWFALRRSGSNIVRYKRVRGVRSLAPDTLSS